MIDLRTISSVLGPAAGVAPWLDAASWWTRISAATADLSAPVSIIDQDALAHNARDLAVRAGGLPIRVATKSVRLRSVLDAVLALPGYQGLLAYSLTEALWLSEFYPDIVVGYPTTDRAALATLLSNDRAMAAITLMIDSIDHIDLIDSVAGTKSRGTVRVAVDVDASWRSPIVGHVGVLRSPLTSVEDVLRLAREVVARPGFSLVGMQMYEAQIAGVPNGGAGNGGLRLVQARSRAEFTQRRGMIADELVRLAPIEFINGGGTGSLESTAADPAVTEVSAGSGLLGGHLFDHYQGFRPAPAAAFALDVVRRPDANTATVHGGGWIASGPPGASRRPLPVWPAGLQYLAREGAGEVQTPLRGLRASSLRLGDRVWFRHAKSGELSEHVRSFYVISGNRRVAEVPTYRGEEKVFL